MQFISIQPIDRDLSGATIPGQSEPGSKGNEGVHRIPQSPRITETYHNQDTGWGGSYPSTEKQSVFSTPPAD